MADFFTQTKRLAEQVGSGTLRGEFAANKIYAVNMHEKGWLNFMGRYGPKEIEHYHRGGGPKFVENPLKERFPEWYQKMAERALEGGAADAMEDAMKDLDQELQQRAPIESGDLRASGTYTVTDNGRVVAHKPSGTTYEA